MVLLAASNESISFYTAAMRHTMLKKQHCVENTTVCGGLTSLRYFPSDDIEHLYRSPISWPTPLLPS